ncbi:MAG: hypothetical protein B6244_01030 [Candidatus Cloacimonetes bacterium 4572_55]|nr:MAG: hypothetical protein B6244_01030 [Candidatus Cloacimonetes bacterium 4572_55]
MAYEFKMRRIIEFVETDMAGIVHFSNFFRFMESVETAFFRSLGCEICYPKPVPTSGLPRVHAECDYLYPLRFEDEIEIHLIVREISEKSITYNLLFNRVAPSPVQIAAKGKLIVAFVSYDPVSGVIKSEPIPSGIRSKIEVAPPSRLDLFDNIP